MGYGPGHLVLADVIDVDVLLGVDQVIGFGVGHEPIAIFGIDDHPRDVGFSGGGVVLESE